MKNITSILLIFLIISCTTSDKNEVFARENIVPWSIVGFDIKERTPEQRLQMLQSLGYHKYGYGHRARHISTMEHEWRLAAKNEIAVQNVWMYLNLSKDKVGDLREQNEVVLQNLKKVGLKTQIWIGLDSRYFENKTDKESFSKTLDMITYLAKRAQKLNCKIALYNHGGWYGKPENQLRIIEALPEYEIGVVYNFHHAHESLEKYSKNIQLLLPYLWCVNLNGMKKEGPKIITIGKGNLEKDMIQKLMNLGYKGPWGILGHVKGGDPEVVLTENYKGLLSLFPQK